VIKMRMGLSLYPFLFLFLFCVCNNVSAEMVSSPSQQVYVGDEWSYTAVSNASDPDWSFTTNADWLIAYGNFTIAGIPKEPGIFWVNVSDGDGYQNFSLAAKAHNDAILLLSLVISFGLTFLAVIKPEIQLLAGFVWIFSAVAVFSTYGFGWLIIGLGFGLIQLFVGGIEFGS